jgi:hypothetical protein
MKLNKEEAEAVLHLSNTNLRNWGGLMAHIDRVKQQACKELEEATDMVSVARQQGRISICKEFLALSDRAKAMSSR